MNILNLSLGQDTGGQQWRLSQAWKRHRPNDTYTSVTVKPTFYPIHHRYNEREVVEELWPAADVVHFHNDLSFLRRFAKYRLPKKPLLIHHHGTMFRTRPEYHLRHLDQYQATAIGSTLDLVAIAPDRLRWLPQAYSAEELYGYRTAAASPEGTEPGPTKIVQCPTNRPIKSTAALITAVNRLRSIGVQIDLEIVEAVSNREALKKKAEATIFFDQVLLGYGCNAIEAMGMGIPVIAGVNPHLTKKLIRQSIPMTTREQMISLWGFLPFYETDEDGIYKAIAKLLRRDVQREYAEKGTQHFHRWHEESRVVDQLESIYLEMLGS